MAPRGLSSLLAGNRTPRARPTRVAPPRPRSAPTAPRAPAPPTTTPDDGPSPADDAVAQMRARRGQTAPGGTPTPEPRPGAPVPVFPTKPAGGGGGQGGWGSLPGQLGAMIGGIGPAIAMLTEQAAWTTVAPLKIGLDAARGDIDWDRYSGGLNGRDIYNNDNLTQKTKDYIDEQGLPTKEYGLSNAFHDYIPLTAMMADSATRTGGRINEARKGDFSQYVDAWNEGHILDLAFEDIGNVGMGGAIAGKIAGRAAIGNAMLTVEEAGALGAKAMRPGGVGSALSRSVLSPSTGVGAAKRAPHQIPGTGLAGKMTPGSTAEKVVAGTGAGIRKVARLGEAVDNAQLSLLPRLIFLAAKKGGGPAVRGVGRAAQTYSNQNPGRWANMVGRFGTDNRAFAREVHRIEADLGREMVATQRVLMHAETIADAAGLTISQSRAAIFNVDQVFLPLVEQYRAGVAAGLNDATLTNIIERAYADLPATLRPELDDLKAYDDWESGRIDPELGAKMDEVDAAVREVSEADTAKKVELGPDVDGGIDPAQLEPEAMPEYVAQERRRLEIERDRDVKKLDKLWTGAARAARQADVREAVNAELPPPPDPKRFASEGEKLGFAKAHATALRTQHQMLQSELRATLDRYERAVNDDAGAATVARLEKELDRKLVQGEKLRDDIAVAERRVDAAIPLSRVKERLVEPAAPSGSLLDTPPRPEVSTDLSGLDTPAAMKRAAAVIREAEQGQVLLELHQMTSGDRPIMEGQWEDLGTGPEATRLKKNPDRGQWLGIAHRQTSYGAVGRGSTPENFADTVMDALNIDPTTVSVMDVLEMYFGAVNRYYDVRAAGNYRAVTDISADTGFSREAVQMALEGKAGDFRHIVQADRISAVDDVAAVFAGMEPSVREGILNELRDMRAKGLPEGEILDYMTEVMESEKVSARLLDPIWTSVSWNQLSDWLVGESPVPDAVYERVVSRPDLAQSRQIARMQQRLVDLKAAERSTGVDQRRLADILEKHTAKVARDAATAARRVDDAVGAEQRAAAAADAFDGSMPVFQATLDAAAAARRTWKRRKGKDAQGNETSPYSPAERAIRQEGTLRERANVRLAAVQNVERSLAGWNAKIAELPTELKRDFIERLIKDKNQPAIKSIASSIRGIEAQFGRLEPGKADTPDVVTGVMGDMAHKYGVHDELVAQLHDELKVAENGQIMPVAARGALQRVLEDGGVRLDDVDLATIERSWQADQLLAEIDQIVTRSAENGGAANTPFRVIDHVRRARWIDDLKMPDEVMSSQGVRSQVEARWAQYAKARTRFLQESYDAQLRVMPKTWRAIGQHARRNIDGLLTEAEVFADAGDHTSAALLMELAEDVPTTMQQMADAGLDPQYLPGGEPPLHAQTAGRPSGGRRSALRASHESTTGLRAVDLADQTSLQIDQAAKFLQNSANDFIKANMGRPAKSVIGDAIKNWERAHPHDTMMHPSDIKAALNDAGYDVPAGTRSIGYDTVVIPKAIADQLSRADRPGGVIYQTVDKGNRMFKTGVLALSPRWLTGNLVGNAFMAMFNYGMSPIELMRVVNDIQKLDGGWKQLWEQGGLASFAPDALASHGLTYNEHRLRYGEKGQQVARTRAGRGLNRVAEYSYNMNEFVDNIGRSAVYLKELQKTGNADAAVRAGLRTMGDFTRMTPFERNYVRQAMPFYAWMRHQTVAAVRLPLQSPTRAAWLLHLSNMMNDPEYGDEMRQLLGSRMPLGGGNFLNIGGLSPFGDPRSLPLDPTRLDTFTGGFSPVIDLTGKALGVDIDRMRPVTRPFGDQATDMWGGVVPKSPIRRAIEGDPLGGLGEIGYQASGILPQTRALRDAVLGPGDFRYGSGDRGPEQFDDEAPATGHFGDLVLRGLNLPRIDRIDTKQLLRDQRKREIDRRRREASRR